jgi:hypothetical protein
LLVGWLYYFVRLVSLLDNEQETSSETNECRPSSTVVHYYLFIYLFIYRVTAATTAERNISKQGRKEGRKEANPKIITTCRLVPTKKFASAAARLASN